MCVSGGGILLREINNMVILSFFLDHFEHKLHDKSIIKDLYVIIKY